MGRTSSVDTRALLDAGQALASTARLVHDARSAAACATTGDGWAVDGMLPSALGRYAATLDAVLGRLADDTREASALLALAASRYARAERAAAAPGGPVGVPGASRDASARPWG
jgi:hypothetical protein